MKEKDDLQRSGNKTIIEFSIVTKEVTKEARSEWNEAINVCK